MDSLSCSVLIHSRTKYCDFRSKFLISPDDFLDEKVKEMKKMILQTTVSIEEILTSNKCRKIVISDKNHVVCGITASMSFFANYKKELSNIQKDEHGRSIYLFVGVVVKKDATFKSMSFPSYTVFSDIIEKYVMPRWNEKPYDDKSNQSSFVGYDEVLRYDKAFAQGSEYHINYSVDSTKFCPNNRIDDVIKSGLFDISKETSVCTNFSYKDDAEKSDFLNVTVAGHNTESIIYKKKQTAVVSNGKRPAVRQIQPSGKQNDKKTEIRQGIKALSNRVQFGRNSGISQKYKILFDVKGNVDEKLLLESIKKVLDRYENIENVNIYSSNSDKNNKF